MAIRLSSKPRALVTPVAARASAAVESEAMLADWIDFAWAMLRKGTPTLIHRADRLGDLLAALHGRTGGVIVFRLAGRGQAGET